MCYKLFQFQIHAIISTPNPCYFSNVLWSTEGHRSKSLDAFNYLLRLFETGIKTILPNFVVCYSQQKQICKKANNI